MFLITCVCPCDRVVMVYLGEKVHEALRDDLDHQDRVTRLNPQSGLRERRGREWVQLSPQQTHYNLLYIIYRKELVFFLKKRSIKFCFFFRDFQVLMEILGCRDDLVPQEVQESQWVRITKALNRAMMVQQCSTNHNVNDFLCVSLKQGSQGLPGSRGTSVSPGISWCFQSNTRAVLTSFFFFMDKFRVNQVQQGLKDRRVTEVKGWDWF